MVRYEASLLYMAHPHGKLMTPMNKRQVTFEFNKQLDKFDKDIGLVLVINLLPSIVYENGQSVWSILFKLPSKKLMCMYVYIL